MQEQLYVISRDGKPVGIVRDNPATGPLSWFHREHSGSMDNALQYEGYSVAEGEPDCNDVAAILEGIAERVGLTAEFEFVPFSRSRNAKPQTGEKTPWKGLNWNVTLKRSGRAILTTDYGQGVAYAPAYSRFPQRTREAEEAIDIEIETGREASRIGGGLHASTRKIKPPRLGDVLQSLASDARVLDQGTFEDWASSLGYDTDSRSAEAIWQACVNIATALRAALGARTLEELQLAAEFN